MDVVHFSTNSKISESRKRRGEPFAVPILIARSRGLLRVACERTQSGETRRSSATSWTVNRLLNAELCGQSGFSSIIDFRALMIICEGSSSPERLLELDHGILVGRPGRGVLDDQIELAGIPSTALDFQGCSLVSQF